MTIRINRTFLDPHGVNLFLNLFLLTHLSPFGRLVLKLKGTVKGGDAKLKTNEDKR
jgi:hypothetical protein